MYFFLFAVITTPCASPPGRRGRHTGAFPERHHRQPHRPPGARPVHRPGSWSCLPFSLCPIFNLAPYPSKRFLIFLYASEILSRNVLLNILFFCTESPKVFLGFPSRPLVAVVSPPPCHTALPHLRQTGVCNICANVSAKSIGGECAFWYPESDSYFSFFPAVVHFFCSRVRTSYCGFHEGLHVHLVRGTYITDSRDHWVFQWV